MAADGDLPEAVPLLTVKDMRAWYGKHQVLRGVGLQVLPGEVVGLFGHNGAGKSTLLKSILGIEVRSSGTVIVDGLDISGIAPSDPRRRLVGIVPQGIGVFSTLRVSENVLLGAHAGVAQGGPGEGTAAMVRQQLPVVDGRWSDYAGALSGGQRQMVSIARTLVQRPRVLLLDEPLTGLAPRMTREVMDLVGSFRSSGLGVIVVEQNIRATLPILDRGYVIRGGKIVLEGGREMFEDPVGLVEYF